MPFPHEEEEKKYKTRKFEKRKLKAESGTCKKKLKTDSGDIVGSGSVDCGEKKSAVRLQLETDSTDADDKQLEDSGGELLDSVYWKDLAEERRLALEEALVENQKLTERVEALEAENRDLEEMLGDAKALAEMINTMTDETVDESGIGKDIDTTLNTSTEAEPTE